jgi:polyphosphate kinase 2 (PPK2 family)
VTTENGDALHPHPLLLGSLGEYVDPSSLADLRVDDSDDDDPVLYYSDGRPVDTWREDYPYDERLPRAEYDQHKRLLQIELLKLQNWIKESGERLVVLFEGRDAAGKGARSSGSPST